MSAQEHQERAEFSYHLLRVASERFERSLCDLTTEQRAQVERQARQTFDLENLVLSSPEARDTLIPDQRLDEAVAQIRRRYPDEQTFESDLASNGLDQATLRLALHRELIFDGVMQLVGARAEPVTEVDERLFYELHNDRFSIPERRTASHILVTINEDYAENSREAALARLERVAAELCEHPERFAALARTQSECPTAMEDGELGTVQRGALYPQLDAALFGLTAGEVSGVVESEIGFHLLRCEAIEPAVSVSFEQARPKIQAAMDARRRRDCQKMWIARLREESAAPA